MPKNTPKQTSHGKLNPDDHRPTPLTRNHEKPETPITTHRRAKNRHNRHTNPRKTAISGHNYKNEMVGSPGFEPGITWTQATYLRPSSTTTPPQPEKRQPNLTLSKPRLTHTSA